MKKFDTMGRIGQLRKPEQERTGRRNRNGPESGTGTDRKAEQERTGKRNRNGPESGIGMGRKVEHETAVIQEKDSLQ